MRPIVLAACFAGFACAACVREGAPVVAAVEVNDSDAGLLTPTVIAQQATSANQCSLHIRAAPIETQPTCTLDERISKSAGVLLVPCKGDGPADAIFGEHRFEGRVSNGAIKLALTTNLEWEDHCQWETKQSIQGAWRSEGKHAKLLWRYSEAPVTGTQCFGSCTATAGIEIDEPERSH